MTDETRIYDAYIAGRQSAALAAAVRLRLFDLLDAERLELPELAARMELEARPLGHLTRVLVAMGVLERHGESLALSADASAFLVRGRPGSLVGLIDLEVENFLSPRIVIDSIRRNAPAVYAGDDPWRSHQDDPVRAQAFTRAMHDISSAPAEALARAVDFSYGGRLLDLGGGSGALAIALARAWPRLHCTVVDLAAVCQIAEEYIRKAEVSERVETRALDFFRDPLPSQCDAVLLSQILHDWDLERGERLLRRCRAALRPGGRLLIHEKLVASDGSGPLANALVDLDMLAWTQGQQYSAEALRGLLERVGFEWIGVRPTRGYWSVVEGRAPGGAGPLPAP